QREIDKSLFLSKLYTKTAVCLNLLSYKQIVSYNFNNHISRFLKLDPLERNPALRETGPGSISSRFPPVNPDEECPSRQSPRRIQAPQGARWSPHSWRPQRR